MFSLSPSPRSRALSAPIALACLLSLSGVLAPQASAQNVTTVMTGLFNPRGITVASDGSLYVAEAGRGGSGTQIVGAAGEAVSYGNTGGVSRLQNGVQQRLISTLPSLALSDGTQATGLHDIIQTSDGTFYGVTGFVGDPSLRNNFTGSGENGKGFGQLVRFDFTGTPSATYTADLSANEATNPDGSDVNTNPYSLAQNGTGFVVADAGANVLLDVTSGDTVTTKTIFPAQPTGTPGPPTYQAVPTSVISGLDAQGNSTLFVGQLTGYPFAVGSANVYSVNPTTGAYTTAFTGFTTIIDLAYANGSLYVLDLTTNGLASNQGPGPGVLWQVNVATGTRTQLLNNLFFPGGIAVGQDNTLYVTNGSILPGGGTVISISSAPEPGSIALLFLGALPVAGLVARRKKTA